MQSSYDLYTASTSFVPQGNILGLYWGLYRDNGKEHGDYWNIWDYIGFILGL